MVVAQGEEGSLLVLFAARAASTARVRAHGLSSSSSSCYSSSSSSSAFGYGPLDAGARWGGGRLVHDVRVHVLGGGGPRRGVLLPSSSSSSFVGVKVHVHGVRGPAPERHVGVLRLLQLLRAARLAVGARAHLGAAGRGPALAQRHVHVAVLPGPAAAAAAVVGAGGGGLRGRRVPLLEAHVHVVGAVQLRRLRAHLLRQLPQRLAGGDPQRVEGAVGGGVLRAVVQQVVVQAAPGRVRHPSQHLVPPQRAGSLPVAGRPRPVALRQRALGHPEAGGAWAVAVAVAGGAGPVEVELHEGVRVVGLEGDAERAGAGRRRLQVAAAAAAAAVVVGRVRVGDEVGGAAAAAVV